MPFTAVQQDQLRDDLRGLIKGEVRCDEITRHLYSTDASILQIKPVCVVYPRNKEDVVTVVKYAADIGVPVHARGSGTGITGECLGEGIILVFSRFMRRILAVNEDNVIVQPGLFRRRLNGVLAETQGRYFGPAAGNPCSATIGSLLARNGAGIHYLRNGLPSDHVLSLTAVLADGNVMTARRNAPIQPLPGTNSVALAQEIVHGKEYVLAGQTAQIADSLQNQRTKMLNVNRAGYAVQSAIQPGGVDLTRLLTGSEGTLGLIVEAKIKTEPLRQRVCAAAFFFENLHKAVWAVPAVLPTQPVLCELIDRRRLTMIRDWDVRYDRFIPAEAEAVLMVEWNESEPPADKLKDIEALCSLRVHTPDDFQLFDEFIRRSEQVLYRMNHSVQPIPLFDDIAVPAAALPAVLEELHRILQHHKLTASFSGHVGQGHLRIHPLMDLSVKDAFATLHPLAEEVYAMVIQYGGTISSEWGTGLLKTSFLPMQFPNQMNAFRQIKETFDPHYLLNPGKVIPSGQHWLEHLRHGLSKRGQSPPEPLAKSGVKNGKAPAGSSITLKQSQDTAAVPDQLEIQLRWEPAHVFEPAYRCNGCGECLRYDRQTRVCPFFRGSTDQMSAPRTKADILRGILEKDIDLDVLTDPQTKEIADACFQCRMCGIECPAKADINVLSFRSKAAYAATHGLPLEDLFVSHFDTVLKLLSPVSCLFNAAMRTRFFRWAAEKTFQIPQGRMVPSLAYRSFLNRMRRQRKRPAASPLSAASVPTDKIVLFVDTFVNYFDPQLAELAVQILERCGISVFVPLRQKTSGLFSFAVGHADKAESLARYNTALLTEMIRQGYRVITLEPTAASCLTKDYRHLLAEDEDAALVAENTFDLCTFLLGKYRQGGLNLDFRRLPYRVGYHAPCRGLSVSVSRTSVTMPAEHLLRLIPELQVRRVEQGCCGMAGFWGFRQRNYRQSLQMGTPLFRAIGASDIDFAVSDCSGCCLQIEHGTKKRAWHPVRLFAVACGLLPATELC
ncbi:MAG: FAD-binding protein [Planctomycetaceae bacterium]|jgi:FAD/FMN-containing dehydrogenase/Fe-S oxidoreductase|nr:FAD-binding protein [Planctomycetaceae bacterium]